MGAAIAPRRYLSGVMPSCDAVRSYKRLLELKPASYMDRVTECPARRLSLSWLMRQESAYARGVIPRTRLNVLCKWNGLWRNSDASLARVSGSSRCCSIKRHIALTISVALLPPIALG